MLARARLPLQLLAAAGLAAGACSDAAPPADAAAADAPLPGLDVLTADAPETCRMPAVEEIDLSIGGLGSFALSNVHRCWTADPAVHESAGPHGVTGVRTFYNDVIVASLRAGNTVHPRGSILVKELYDGEAIDGYAVNIKVEDGEGSDKWLFFEGFAPTFAGFYGRAEPLCAGCHVGGRDHVLSQLPP